MALASQGEPLEAALSNMLPVGAHGPAKCLGLKVKKELRRRGLPFFLDERPKLLAESEERSQQLIGRFLQLDKGARASPRGSRHRALFL